jgi:hypothetical protein
MVAEPASAAYGYYLVQFVGPIQNGWKEALTGLGAETLAYVPDFAFKVRMVPGLIPQIQRLEPVTWVGAFHPAYKLSPELALGGARPYTVRVERGADAGQATAAIARSGARVLSRDDNILTVAADAAQVEAIARVLDVAWVQNYALRAKHNEYGAGAIMGAGLANASGYDGSSQITAVCDTGFGDGTAAGAHPDVPASRIVSINNWPGQTNICFQTIVDDGPQDVDSGHGTHTAGSVLSDGGASGEGQGTAPAAKLVFQATENWAYISNYCQMFGGWPAEGYFLTGLPDDLRELYQQAYDDGARIHSNSWGAALAGDYTVDSANTDDFVWTNPDMAITFSAGNEGTDANGNGVVDNDSIGSPGTAKNVITVGASENDRLGNYQCDTGLPYTSQDAYQPGETCSSMGGNNLLGTYGQRYPADFPAQPLAGDVTAGNQDQMAAWSSRGPADDGRIKPDVVAPGTWVLSNFSGLYQEGYGDPLNPQNGVYQWDGWGMPLNETYKYMGGTSMANPLVAGAATVVRDFYHKAYSHSASAALVKATLINSAVDLLDENNDGANDNDYPIPNVHEGWGRVDLAAATDGSHQFVEAAGLGTGGSNGYQYTVTSSGTPFKVTLVWSDYPSTEAAAANLVNDLDLVVTAPGGAVYRGNVFASGWTQTGGNADRTNNVENVYVQSPGAGAWTVQVSGYNVPDGPQPYALVVDGSFGEVDTPPTTSILQPVGGTTVAGQVPVQIEATDAEDAAGSLIVEWNVDGGAWQGTTYDGASGYYEASWDSTTATDGVHAINARAVDSASGVGSDSNSVTVDNQPDAYLHVGDLDGAKTQVRNKWTATVTIAIHDDAHGPVSQATVTGTWSDGASGTSSCTTTASSTCEVSLSGISNKVASVRFTVNNVTHNTLIYQPEANHEEEGDSDGTSIVVPPPVNQPPVATFTYSCSDLTCDFDGSGSSDPDGTIGAYAWDFGDGSPAGSGINPSHTYPYESDYDVTLTVTDDDGATGIDTQSVSLGGAQAEIYVYAIEMAGKQAGPNLSATATVTIRDTNGNLVEGATVSGEWSDDYTGTASGLTGADGTVTLASGKVRQSSATFTFTVQDVNKGGYTYNPALNGETSDSIDMP